MTVTMSIATRTTAAGSSARTWSPSPTLTVTATGIWSSPTRGPARSDATQINSWGDSAPSPYHRHSAATHSRYPIAPVHQETAMYRFPKNRLARSAALVAVLGLMGACAAQAQMKGNFDDADA